MQNLDGDPEICHPRHDMFQQSIRLKQLLLLGGDYLVFQLALWLTLTMRYGGISESIGKVHLLPFSLLGIIWLVCFYVTGLYDLLLTRDSLRFFRSYLEGMLLNLLLAVGFFYLIPFGIEPRTNLILYFALALLFGYAWRLVYNRWIAQTLFRNRVLFIGRTDDAARIRDLLTKSALGFELTAVVETAPGSRFTDGAVTWYADFRQIESILKERGIHTVVLGHRPDDIPGLRDALFSTIFTPVAFLDRASLEEVLTGRVPLEQVTQTWFIEHLREGEKAWYDSAKRVGDLLLSLPIGAVTIFLLPFVAAAIKISSPGPILYSQIRVGRMNSSFRIWKFRSMRQDAEIAGQPQWAKENDPRITKIGLFLRKTRIDELPQIWNVLRGDMSFIGPRPERPEFAEELTRQMPYYQLRHLTRPGLTGWAQVKFPYAGTVEDNLKKLQYDLYYVKHRSLLLDAAIFLKTIGIVLRRQGT